MPLTTLFSGSSLRPKSAIVRELLRIFARLANDPFIEGGNTQKDSTGRHCQVKRFGAWSVTYWPEHLASQVHIIDVERLF
jgi:hypothetical protein